MVALDHATGKAQAESPAALLGAVARPENVIPLLPLDSAPGILDLDEHLPLFLPGRHRDAALLVLDRVEGVFEKVLEHPREQLLIRLGVELLGQVRGQGNGLALLRDAPAEVARRLLDDWHQVTALQLRL